MSETPGNAVRLGPIAEQVAQCTRCGLARTRTRTVFGEGNPDTPLVLVGEGPGETEDATGRPFVGKAGQLLDECMAAVRLSRHHVFICNTVKCRACVTGGERVLNRAPEPGEIAACNVWLTEQLAVIRPLVIVCLGNPSANTLIHPDFRMVAEHGRWFSTSPHAHWICAAPHPAYVLRKGGMGSLEAQWLINDLESARRKVIEVRRKLAEDAGSQAARE